MSEKVKLNILLQYVNRVMQTKLHYSNRVVVQNANSDIIDAIPSGKKLRRVIRTWLFGHLSSM